MLQAPHPCLLCPPSTLPEAILGSRGTRAGEERMENTKQQRGDGSGKSKNAREQGRQACAGLQAGDHLPSSLLFLCRCHLEELPPACRLGADTSRAARCWPRGRLPS